MRLPIPPSGQKKTTVVVVLFYNFCIYFVKYLRESNCDIGKDLSIKHNVLFGHASDKGTVFISLFFYCSRKSFDSKFSKISLFFFSTYISVLSLFNQCQSYLFVYLASSESKPLRKSDKFLMSSLSLKPVCYSYHLNYWL